MCKGSVSIVVDCDGVEGAYGGREVLSIGLLMRPRLDCGRSCEQVTRFTVVVIGVRIGVGWIGIGYGIDKIGRGGGGTRVMFDGN